MKMMQKNKITKAILVFQASLLILGYMAILPAAVNAQVYSNNKYPLLEPLPCIPGTGQSQGGKDCVKGTTIKEVNVEQYVNYVFNFSIAAAVLLSVIMIFIGGFQYVTSEIPGAKSDAKSRIQGAIGGLIMVLVSYLILYTLDPRLTNIKLGLPRIETAKYKISSSFLDSLSALGDSSALTAAKRYESEAKKEESADLWEKALAIRNEWSKESDPDKKKALDKNFEDTVAKAKEAGKQATILDLESKSTEKLGAIQSLIDNNAPLADIEAQRAAMEVELSKSRTSLKEQGLTDDNSLYNKYKLYSLSADDAIMAKNAMDMLDPARKSFPISSLFSLNAGLNVAAWLGGQALESGKEILTGSTNAETARKIALQLKYDETALQGLSQEDKVIVKNQRTQMADKILAAGPKELKNEAAFIKQITDTNERFNRAHNNQ